MYVALHFTVHLSSFHVCLSVASCNEVRAWSLIDLEDNEQQIKDSDQWFASVFLFLHTLSPTRCLSLSQVSANTWENAACWSRFPCSPHSRCARFCFQQLSSVSFHCWPAVCCLSVCSSFLLLVAHFLPLRLDFEYIEKGRRLCFDAAAGGMVIHVKVYRLFKVSHRQRREVGCLLIQCDLLPSEFFPFSSLPHLWLFVLSLLHRPSGSSFTFDFCSALSATSSSSSPFHGSSARECFCCRDVCHVL